MKIELGCIFRLNQNLNPEKPHVFRWSSKSTIIEPFRHIKIPERDKHYQRTRCLCISLMRETFTKWAEALRGKTAWLFRLNKRKERVSTNKSGALKIREKRRSHGVQRDSTSIVQAAWNDRDIWYNVPLLNVHLNISAVHKDGSIRVRTGLLNIFQGLYVLC